MRKLMILTMVVVLAAVMGGGAFTGGAITEGSSRTVAITGGVTFQPNAIFQSNFGFRPRAITVNSGDTVTWVNRDQLGAPHTITIVGEGEVPNLPASFPANLACLDGPDPRCDVRRAGFHGGPTCPEAVLDPDDDGGLSTPGDSICLASGGGAISAAITAPPDTTLFYLCAFHPWMQGSINVR